MFSNVHVSKALNYSMCPTRVYLQALGPEVRIWRTRPGVQVHAQLWAANYLLSSLSSTRAHQWFFALHLSLTSRTSNSLNSKKCQRISDGSNCPDLHTIHTDQFLVFGIDDLEGSQDGIEVHVREE